jgi:hypothetical protein
MLGAGGAAAITTLFSRNQAEAGHDATNVLHLGEENFSPAGQETEVNADVEGFGFRVNNNGASGEDAASGAVQGHSDAGVAGRFTTNTGESLHCDGRALIFGSVEDNLLLMENEQAGGNGLSATASGSYGVEGVNVSTDPDPEGITAGVVGVSSGEDYGDGPGTGVLGLSGTGVGVSGFSQGTGVAVQGDSQEGIGVSARSDGGVALHVAGKAAFSNVGSAEIGAGQGSAFVNQDQVTADSHISVTLTSNAAGRSVSWVDRSPGSGFTVHLTKKGPAVGLTFQVVEPG